MKVIVGSTGAAKLEAGRISFAAMFPDQIIDIQGVQAKSGVPDQPMGRDQTLSGAWNRIKHARELIPDADYWIAFESGIEDIDGRLSTINWMVAENRAGLKSRALGGGFLIPTEIEKLVREGMELGPAVDQVMGLHDSKNDKGLIGILAHDVQTRASVYAEGMIMALYPFKNPELYG